VVLLLDCPHPDAVESLELLGSLENRPFRLPNLKLEEFVLNKP
jgi:hypothetical protein